MSKKKTRNTIELREDYAVIICAHKGQTREILIDLEDVGRVTQHKWSIGEAHGYLAVQTSVWTPGKGQRNLRLARFLLGVQDKIQVDHKNRNSLDCRKRNMRPATRHENAQNLSPDGKGKSGRRGVTLISTGRYRARVVINSTFHNLGYFDDLETAAKVASDFRAQHMPFSQDYQAARRFRRPVGEKI